MDSDVGDPVILATVIVSAVSSPLSSAGGSGDNVGPPHSWCLLLRESSSSLNVPLKN